MDRPLLQQALASRDKVLRAFLDAEGRIIQLPAKAGKRLVVLDHVAQAFEIGRRYREEDVNATLSRYHPDYALMRRYLVDEGFMEREHGIYWRSGGSVEV
jgi:hypothetical protein